MENTLIICPNDTKEKLLEEYSNRDDLLNIKFMNKDEYISNYYYSYDEKTIQYLMDKYNFNIDVCKVYLKSMYSIDINKNYKDHKINNLKSLKIELYNNNLLIENNLFKDYIKNKKIVVKNYYDLDLYEEKALNCKVDIPITTLDKVVVECNTLEDEVNNVCLNILSLLKKGVAINKIFIANVSTDYLYTIDRLFKYYNIPINLNMNYSIYSTKVVKDYLDNNILNIDDTAYLSINKKLINIVNSLVHLDKTKKSYRKILIDKLKSTNLDFIKKKNAINVIDIFKRDIADDEYVFVLGFNQDILPKLEKDIEYLNDACKKELELYTTNEKNTRKKVALIYILSNIKNLYLSFKYKSPFSTFYPSSLISDLNLQKVQPMDNNYNKSNKYNKIVLAEKLDLFYKYGEIDSILTKLNNSYEIPYKLYDNTFTGINTDKYISNIKEPLVLSYSSINDYCECKFKYYLKHVLNLSVFEEKFPNFIGSMYHMILSLYKNPNFNFEKEYNDYLKSRELSFKERLLLIKIKKDLEDLLASLKKQELITGFDKELLEHKIIVPIEDKKIKVIFKGIIDKIMYREQIEDTYYSIIDYKSGFIDTNIEPMKYGLHMQLPVYLYLIKNSSLFKRPQFAGIYYQNILFNYPTCSTEEEYQKLTKDRLKLQGYSTDNTSILELFDTTYQKSEYIKSMSYTEEKGFGTYSKLINEETLDGMFNYTQNIINKVTDDILDGDFSINPKYYNGKNISCEFCEFKDICFTQEKDLNYLNKVEDLSFLGGEE